MPQPITCIIVDDEPNARETFQGITERYFSDRLHIAASVGSVKEAVTAIHECNPDIVFLDIEMPHENGFRLFDYFSTYPFEVVFTTAWQQYAIQAIKQSALDYLLKPINYIDLLAALTRFEKRRGSHTENLRIESLMANLRQGNAINRKIALPSADGYRLVNISEVVYCEADVNYTRVQLSSGASILVSKTLKAIAGMLDGEYFFRIHKTYLVNINYVKSYSRTDGFFITLDTGHQLPVAQRKNDEFLAMLSTSTRPVAQFPDHTV